MIGGQSEALSFAAKSALADVDVYYAPGLSDRSEMVELSGPEYHHMVRSARHGEGELVALTNGRGVMALARIARLEGGRAWLRPEKWLPGFGESARRVLLGVGTIRPQRFDLLVEKATELGVARISPLRTERSRPISSRGRLERWRRIAVAAMKQSQRSVLLEVTPEVSLEKWLLEVAECGARVVAHRGSDLPAARFLQELPAEGPLEVAVLVGPEGGLARPEVEEAVRLGFVQVSLGPRRLRTETAALLLSSLLLNIGPCDGGLHG